jgi:hypothetical protein
MPHDEHQHRAQQLEQVIATVFTCRSLVKYNLSLDEKQQEKMLQDIDASLEVLRGCAQTGRAVRPDVTDIPFSQTDSARIVGANDKTSRPDAHEHETLQALYRMYHAFMDVNKQTNLQAFVSRFNEAMSVLGNVQRLFEENYQLDDTTFSLVQTSHAALPTVIENLLQKVRVFICDLYYIFMEFIRALSSVLQQNDVHLNTEKLSTFPERRNERIRRVQLEKLHEHVVSRKGVQEAYQQLRRRRLQVEPQIGEVAAFLEFLKEILRAPDMKVYQLSEILAQTDAVSRLLAELFHIVTDYEQIIRIGE